MRCAALFRQILTANIGDRVVFQRNSRVTTLLGTVVDQAILADVEVTRARAATPLVGAALGDVVL